MSRLIDLLKREIKQDFEVAALELCQAVVADNIAFYLMDTKQYYECEQLPCLAPPFEDMFIEWKVLKGTGNPKPSIAGAYVHVFDNHSERYPGAYSDLMPDARWMYRVALYHELHPYYPIYIAHIFINEDGTLSTLPENLRNFAEIPYLIQMTPHYKQHLGGEPKGIQPNVFVGFNICLWTIAFFHIQNIKIEDIDPPEKLSKAHQKRHKKPLTSYKTVTVMPFGTKQQAQQKDQRGNHASPAHHIVHGHFRTYSEDAPLFGKYAGTYWVGQHERGKDEHGKVIKDYRIGEIDA